MSASLKERGGWVQSERAREREGGRATQRSKDLPSAGLEWGQALRTDLFGMKADMKTFSATSSRAVGSGLLEHFSAIASR